MKKRTRSKAKTKVIADRVNAVPIKELLRQEHREAEAFRGFQRCKGGRRVLRKGLGD